MFAVPRPTDASSERTRGKTAILIKQKGRLTTSRCGYKKGNLKFPT